MKRKVIKYCLYIIFIGSILASLGYYYRFYWNKGQSEAVLKEMDDNIQEEKEFFHEIAQEKIAAAKEDKTGKKDKSKKKTKKRNEHKTDKQVVPSYTYLDLPKLRKKNEDVYAWLEVPDTQISYPILTSRQKDYYLMHNIDKSYGYPGCIYSDKVNGEQLSDELTVLYGHNMKNESMFGGLYHFREKKYFDEHPYIYIYTDEDIHVYEIAAIAEWKNQNLLKVYGTDKESGCGCLLEDVKEKGAIQYRESIIEERGNALVLSTCVRGQEKKRLLVISYEI